MIKEPVTYTKHKYDLDLIEIYYSLEKYLSNKSLKLKDGVIKEQYLERVKFGIEHLFRQSNLHFPWYFQNKIPFILSSQSPAYEYWLGMSLICSDELLIHRLLDFQKKKYAGKENFVNLVEFRVFEIMQSNSPFENQNRLEKIIQWVERNPNSQTITKTEGNFLVWGDETKKLKMLSRELKIRGFTEKPTDLERVFTEKAKCKWLGSAESLAYLLFKLYKSKKPVKASKGKGYLVVAQLYFSDYSGKVEKKLNLKEAKYNLTKRSPKKFISDVKSIDLAFLEVFGS